MTESTAVSTWLGLPQRMRAGMLDLGCREFGPSDGLVVLLLALSRIKRGVRLGVMLATSGDFFDQPNVADAASELLRDVLGDDTSSVRLVYGVAS